MKRNIVIVAGLVLLAAALIAMPVSAWQGNAGNTGSGCHGQMYQNCVANTGDDTQISGQYCNQNGECQYDCPNNGVRPLDGTGFKHGQGNGHRMGNNAGNCPYL
ncbi:hypothetical protein F1737_01550 [Methanoplanus sp. FWC-SCC4]|uniref:Uncharacterized protein n=1 Tax=Methanochimaera problematica TaxID=2609417 RepID=A0AA97F9S0_9EURY|nr:hypothetical protein [Methanoplanus sp. FWC-SCC4]WOF15455.1 hypothetical protein F1737_01550 [Methanoplanus sp. FWC-SCC4]